MKCLTTRFAPSPTGFLHLGHGYAALFAEQAARSQGGKFLLRIEDIDHTRCRPLFTEAILRDLDWLGLKWEGPVRRQSQHMGDYQKALDRLDEAGLLYPCFCSRADIRREIEASGAAPHGPDGPLYPGLCRRLSQDERAQKRAEGVGFALRLDMQKAVAMAGPIGWHDLGQGWQTARPDLFGDVVLARKEIAASYHLAVTVDDALQEISLITRGEDLFAATHIHRLLQALLHLPVPNWHHHALLADSAGRRLAKRDQAPSLASLREGGADPVALRARLLSMKSL